MKNIILFCDNHQWIYGIVCLLFFIVCFILLVFEIWLSDKLSNRETGTFKQALKAYFLDQETGVLQLDLDKDLPYFAFSPIFLVLSTVILLSSVIYWIFHRKQK
jgi:hypothetical protein